MQIQNDTPFEHALVIGLGPDRQPHLGVVLKATFRLPDRIDATPEPATEQLPTVTGDEFYRGDVTGSVRIESDTVVFKPRADIVLSGTAYAPRGVPVPALDVGIRVGKTQQMLRVFGDRRWTFPTRLMVVPSLTAPEPFVAMPLVYERSFGGFDHKGNAWCDQNVIGRGFLGSKTRQSVDGRSLPNIEDPEHLIRSWDDRPEPVGMGFFGRSWQPRASYTGRAVDDVDPDFGLPSDFDHRYYNGAHPALQVPGYLIGNEPVDLLNVTPDGHRRFALPGIRPRMELRSDPPTGNEPDSGPEGQPSERLLHTTRLAPVLDTLVFLPDDGVFYLVWRASIALARDMEAALAQIRAIELTIEDAGLQP